MKPPQFNIDPTEWVIVRKAVRILEVKDYLIYTWIYNYVFKDILYIDGTIYLKISELEELRTKIDNGEKILPDRIPNSEVETVKTKPVTYRPFADEELSNDPNLDLFQDSKQRARKITEGRTIPVSKSKAKLPKNHTWVNFFKEKPQ